MLLKSEMLDLLIGIKNFFPKFECGPDAVDAWFRLFERETSEAMRQAIDQVLRTSSYAPKPADVSAALGRFMQPAPDMMGGREAYDAAVRYYWELMKRDLDKGTITIYRRHERGFSITTRRRTTEQPVGSWSFAGEILPRFMEPRNPDIDEDLGFQQTWSFDRRRNGLALIQREAI